MSNLERAEATRRAETCRLHQTLEGLRALYEAYGAPLGLDEWLRRRLPPLAAAWDDLDRRLMHADAAVRRLLAPEVAAVAAETRAVREHIEQVLEREAAREADHLLDVHAYGVEQAILHALCEGRPLEDLAVVVVDRRSPDLPDDIAALERPLHVGGRKDIAQLVRSASPIVADGVKIADEPFAVPVVVLVYGRALLCLQSTQEFRAFGHA